MPDTVRINSFLQRELRRQRMEEVTAVEAARWLHKADILKDSKSRPGLPLRKLLRAKRISGQRQEPNKPFGRWYITCVREG